MPAFDGVNPIDLLDDPAQWVAYTIAVGGMEQAELKLLEAFRDHMDRHGVMTALDLAEKLDHLKARLEEFAV
jgi:hypothetical protein